MLQHQLVNVPRALKFSFDRLVSREPIWTSLEELKNFNIIDKWREKWSLQTPFNYEIISDPTLPVKGFQFERDIRVKLNRTRTGHGR